MSQVTRSVRSRSMIGSEELQVGSYELEGAGPRGIVTDPEHYVRFMGR
jgi:hypothetical protein